jgi:hypothetical protein
MCVKITSLSCEVAGVVLALERSALTRWPVGTPKGDPDRNDGHEIVKCGDLWIFLEGFQVMRVDIVQFHIIPVQNIERICRQMLKTWP